MKLFSLFQPWRCLWLLFLEQMTITLPLRLMTLHLSHMGLTDGLTFILISSELMIVRLVARSDQLLLRQVILPLVRSYGLISSLTVSPGMMRM